MIGPFLINQITEIINIFLVKLNTLQTSIQTKGLVEVLKSSGFLSNYVKQEVFHNFSDPEMVTDLQIKLQSSMAQLSNMWSSYAQSLGNFAVNFVTGFVTFLIKGGLVITLAVLFSIEKVSVMKFIASL